MLDSREIEEGNYNGLTRSTAYHQDYVHVGINPIAMCIFGAQVLNAGGIGGFEVLLRGSQVADGLLQTRAWRRQGIEKSEYARGAWTENIAMVTALCMMKPNARGPVFRRFLLPCRILMGGLLGLTVAGINFGIDALEGWFHWDHLSGFTVGAAWGLIALRGGKFRTKW